MHFLFTIFALFFGFFQSSHLFAAPYSEEPTPDIFSPFRSQTPPLNEKFKSRDSPEFEDLLRRIKKAKAAEANRKKRQKKRRSSSFVCDSGDTSGYATAEEFFDSPQNTPPKFSYFPPKEEGEHSRLTPAMSQLGLRAPDSFSSASHSHKKPPKKTSFLGFNSPDGEDYFRSPLPNGSASSATDDSCDDTYTEELYVSRRPKKSSPDPVMFPMDKATDPLLSTLESLVRTTSIKTVAGHEEESDRLPAFSTAPITDSSPHTPEPLDREISIETVVGHREEISHSPTTLIEAEGGAVARDPDQQEGTEIASHPIISQKRAFSSVYGSFQHTPESWIQHLANLKAFEQQYYANPEAFDPRGWHMMF